MASFFVYSLLLRHGAMMFGLEFIRSSRRAWEVIQRSDVFWLQVVNMCLHAMACWLI